MEYVPYMSYCRTVSVSNRGIVKEILKVTTKEVAFHLAYQLLK